MALRVLLLDERDQARSDIGDLISGMGYTVVGPEPPGRDLVRRVSLTRPDVLMIRTTSPGARMLSALRECQIRCPCPVVMYTDDDDVGVIRRAAEAGVSAYVVDDIETPRLRAIVESARVRFERYRQLEAELTRTRAQLSDRKRIERAKGLIMEQKGMKEGEAYQLLRRTAMERNKRLAEIADGIIDAYVLLRAGV